MHVIAAKAVTFHEAMQPSFVAYQSAVVDNAQTLARELQAAGFRLVSGGTDNHLLLVDLTRAGITGKQAEEALDRVGISVNKNAIPFDPRPPAIASGVRLGTPAVTTRGFGPQEMVRIADMIVRVISHPDEDRVEEAVKEEVAQLCQRFPIPGLED